MQPASSLLATVLPALLRRAPLTQEKLDFAWRTVVGPALARATRIRLADGTLVVSADDPRWADEVRRARHAVLARVRELVGDESVRHLRIETR